MIEFEFDETQVEEISYKPIPAGSHRIRVDNITLEESKADDPMYKIVFDVSGEKSKLFHYIVFFKDPAKRKYTHTKLSYIFKSFDGITKDNFKNLEVWLGKVGAGMVVHEEYNGNLNAKIKYFISKEDAKELPEWVEGKQPEIKKIMNNKTNEDIPF